MIRIPKDKIYRAFPELDKFSDHQCELFIRRVHNTEGRTAGLTIGSLAGGFISLLVLAWIATAAFGPLVSMLARWLSPSRSDDYVLNGSIIVVICGAALCALVARDLLLRHFISRAIHMRIERIRCLECKYSLLGQRVTDNHVTCPECGHRMPLTTLGVESAEDLLPTADVQDEFCPGCGDDLGFDLDQCQACGWRADTASRS